jgi:succinate dehydrogenase hydrophobic anchor subunit
MITAIILIVAIVGNIGFLGYLAANQPKWLNRMESALMFVIVLTACVAGAITINQIWETTTKTSISK